MSWLQIRYRWHEIQPNIKKNDLVLLKEAKTKGRRDYPEVLVNTFPDAHGLVRNVEKKLANGQTFVRDIRNIVHLEVALYRVINLLLDNLEGRMLNIESFY